MKTSEINIADLELMSMKDVCGYLGVSHTAVLYYTKKYSIPHAITAAGKIYMKKDVELFQFNRADRLKHRKNKVQS